MSDPLGLTVTGLLAVGLSVALGAALPGLLFFDGKHDPTTVTRVGFALVALGWGPLMAYQAGNIPLLETLKVSAESGSLVRALRPPAFPFSSPSRPP